VLNAVVEVEVRQVECVSLVISFQKRRSKVGHKEANGWREVESSIDLAWEFVKSNVFTVMWKNSWRETKKNDEI